MGVLSLRRSNPGDADQSARPKGDESIRPLAEPAGLAADNSG